MAALEHTWHYLAFGIGLASIGFGVVALLGTLYALLFAGVGILAARTITPRTQDSELAAGGDRSTRFLVVIPAHNEESGLTPTIHSVLAQDYPYLHCVVVADNCTDHTAEVAKAAGAHEVLIRTDPEKRGKGQALSWAFHLKQDQEWDCVCVIDADSVIEPGFFAAMDISFKMGQQVVQSRYDFFPASDQRNWLKQFSAVSKAGENSFVARPRERMGLSGLLGGNGFIVARKVLERVPWIAHSIVEDAEYSLLLAEQGIDVHYQEQAQLWSRQPANARDATPQRIRWASGVWQLLGSATPCFIAMAWRRRSWRPLEQLLMLFMTSRLVLVYLWMLALLLSLVLPSLFPFTWSLLAIVAGLQLLYLLLMLRFAGDDPVSFRAALLLPYYVGVVLWSQAIALSGTNRQLWWRTRR